ncbi:MAG: AFG1-family ATPase [Acidimicrobiia bacterium]|nr:AFG1-family ATPase [Acidimicrobiia bacterium]
MIRLVDRNPRLTAEQLLERLVPPTRFGDVRFETYVPSPEHPSQAAARDAMIAFAAAMSGPDPAIKRRWPFGNRSSAPTGPPARYLDGGYGVGKTHLLASLWHAAPIGPGAKAYLTFAELTAIIGFAGMERAIAAFGAHELLCIDEFELDDVANTLMAVTFLRAVIAEGTKVAATSNTLPDRLGEGRFASEDFRREIAAIADHFQVVRIDGPDYRARDHFEAEPLSEAEAQALVVSEQAAGRALSHDDFWPLVGHLRRVHPVQVAALLNGLDTVVIDGLAPLANQGDALLFAHLIDEIYDAGLRLVATGCPVGQLFPSVYRMGGYRKKYGRCESRLASLLGTARIATRS